MTVKMTMNCDYDSILGVILPVEDKRLSILHLILKLTRTHPLCYTLCQKHSGCVFAIGKNGSNPITVIVNKPLYFRIHLKEPLIKSFFCKHFAQES